MARVIRVLVAEDQAVVRTGFRMLVEAEPDMTCVGEAADGLAAVRLTAELAPDVVLMDVRMPGMDGVEATRRVVAAGGPTRVLVLTTFDLDEHVLPALRAGASGFLVKHTEPAEVLRGIRLVAEGSSLLSPDVTRRLLAHVARGPDPAPAADLGRPPLSLLTPRELDVVREVARARSNTDIARAWWVSEATVRTHVSRAMAKLGARDRAHLVVLAYEHGLAAPPHLT